MFYRNSSRLVIDNENKPTPKKTVITAISPKDEDMPAFLANHILIDGGADVWIDSRQSHAINIHDLELKSKTTLGIVTSNHKNFTLHMGGLIKFANDSFVDFSHINNI